jgi:hypothetical protein
MANDWGDEAVNDWGDAAAKPVAPKRDVSRLESGVRGGLQGLTLGWGDEAAGAISAALPAFLRNKVDDEAVGQGETWRERYQHARDYYRARNKAAEEANPGTYLAGEVVGGTAPLLATGGGGAAAKAAGGGVRLAPALAAAGQGVVAGAGYSDARDLTQNAKDAALGGALGAGGSVVSQKVGGLLSRIGSRAGAKEAAAAARAGAQAAEDVAAPIASARGELGAEVQKGSRYVENLMRLQESMTPEQRALYQELVDKGIVPDLQRAVAGSTLERLPGQAATIAEKGATLEALQSAAPQAVKDRAAQLMQPQFGKDAASFLKSYAEPLVAAYGANKVAEWVGADPEQRAGAAAVAGIVFGRTRAGKALWNRLNRPGNQMSIQQAVQVAVESRPAQSLVAALRSGIPSAATQRELEDH